MSVCNNCRQECEYKNIGFENVTLYCKENCARNLKMECDKIATKEFRDVVQSLKDGGYKNAAVKGILTQANCILNVADNKIASI